MQHMTLGDVLEKPASHGAWQTSLGAGHIMPRVSLSTFLTKATTYESWRAPLDPRLRRALVLSGLAICAMLLTLGALPALLAFTSSGFFLILGPVFAGVLHLLQLAAPLLLAVNVASAVAYAVLLLATRGLQAGRAEWHSLGLGEVIVGAIDAFLLGLPLSIILINAALWIAIVMVGTLVLLAGIGGAGAGASR